MTTVTFASGGTTTPWVAPAGITQVLVEVWGGGGGGTGGPSNAGGGGGGGEYAAEPTYTVIPGNTYTVIVGPNGSGGSSAGTDGGLSSFDGSVIAHGGSKATSANGGNAVGGNGGTGSANSVHFNGGKGGSVSNTKVDGGSGGGSSGGSASAGNAGINATSSGPGLGGAAVTGGGPGGDGSGTGIGNSPSSGPGGGGGGGLGAAGGQGVAGQVQLTFGGGVTKTGSDSGSFSESASVSILIKGTDTGSFTENDPNFHIRVSDSGTFTESGSIHASLSDTDFFTASSETGTVKILIVDSDSGIFTESSAQALTGVIDSDFGYFMETASITTFDAPPVIPLSVFFPLIVKPVVSPIFYGVKHTSTVGVVRWTTSTTIASRIETDWKITEQQITAQKMTQWNNYYRRHKINMGYKFGLPNVIVHPVDWRYDDNQIAWQNDVRRSSNSDVTWNVRQVRVITKRTLWMLNDVNSTFRRTRFNTLLKISIPADARTRYYGIEQPVTHPIAADSHLPSPAGIRWNIDDSLRVLKPVRYNALNSRVKRRSVWWNLHATAVVKQKAASWKTNQRRFRRAETDWALKLRIPRKSSVRYMDNFALKKQKSIHWETLNNKTLQRATSWKMEKRAVTRKVTSFRAYMSRKTFRSSAFKVRFRYHLTEIPGTLKFNARVLQSTVHPITFAPAFSPAKSSTWNFIFEISTQKSTAWNNKKRVSASKRATWESIQRTSKQQRTRFNTILAVTQQDIIEWNVGLVLSQRIHQTSIVREDFAY